jgi:hypothetical protein
VAGLAVGCARTTYPGTTYYTTAPTYYVSEPATTYVYTRPSTREACQAAGGRWHFFSGTCTIPR